MTTHHFHLNDDGTCYVRETGKSYRTYRCMLRSYRGGARLAPDDYVAVRSRLI